MARGGMRNGSGRPTGTGQWGEGTRVLRVPESLYEQVRGFLKCSGQTVPCYAAKVSAGKPMDVTSAIKGRINFYEYLIPNPQDAYCVQVQGDSMNGVGIEDGDMLVVDRSLEAHDQSIVIANLNGDTTVKRLQYDKSGVSLMPENPRHKPIRVNEDDTLIIQGVVRHVVKSAGRA